MPILENDLQQLSRLQIFNIWKQHKSGGQLEGEEKVLAELMQAHPEYHETWDNADKSADKEYDPETDVNPFAHLAIDVAVINQINQQSPIEVSRAYRRLRDKGLGHLDGIHTIDRVFVEELWPVLQNKGRHEATDITAKDQI
jgi:hypothetical protein